MEGVKKTLLDRAENLLTNKRGLRGGTPKVCVPILAYGVFPLVVPSKTLQKRMNDQLPLVGEDKELKLMFPFKTSRWTGKDARLIIRSYVGYIGIGEIDLLFALLRLVKGSEEHYELNRSIEVTPGAILNEMGLLKNGPAFNNMYSRMKNLSQIVIGEDIPLETKIKSGGLNKLAEGTTLAKYSINGLIHFEITKTDHERSVNTKGGEVSKIFEDSLISIGLNDSLYNQMKRKEFRLVDYLLYVKELKGSVAKLLYVYLIFHNVSNFKISLDKLVTTLNVQAQSVRKKRQIIKEAFQEIELATHKAITSTWIKNHKASDIIILRFMASSLKSLN